MNKTELIAAVAEKAEISKVSAAKTVDAVMETIKETLQAGDSVTLIGFGTFSVRDRAARTGRDPRNPSKTIEIKASKVPAFKAGKGLKDAVNGSAKKAK
ncbi:HU family DNA-binding protein [Wohlfahrtiimonas chitiniclastica]|uniref:DNA-binding protein HU-beta n=2 Tax=Wohlfahrtiimonas chitiniclastica TaxID=400946 RepID=L8XVR4_9GAMM|nr:MULTISPECIES: HU family DNA-binding protein [Wohlfahrtiimonas]ELV08123.1 DNA-binding protein HU-beta [Wohlfahrtiimonas chitiniclastica SH04]KZS23045.1 DNA-binding protein HU-beta [Wohlfahrtiimonas chitiniclastica]KZX37596.1 DNA-binding protein HU [Wohlfahrtiimonas chitiniclastica]MBS7815518.1 HU family DNA-binding protein [Wohlfahrtiimonas chitiniclastica]MBS7817571.1 HU family DNA-binding protein [Wohlfahrtiimonas chitiniclastica]